MSGFDLQCETLFYNVSNHFSFINYWIEGKQVLIQSEVNQNWEKETYLEFIVELKGPFN